MSWGKEVEKAAQTRSQKNTIFKSQVTATDRYRTLLNPPANRCGGATNVGRLADKTVEKVSKTNVREVSLIDGGMASKIVCISVGDKKKVTETHSKDLLKTSVQRPNTFEQVMTVKLH